LLADHPSVIGGFATMRRGCHRNRAFSHPPHIPINWLLPQSHGTKNALGGAVVYVREKTGRGQFSPVCAVHWEYTKVERKMAITQAEIHFSMQIPWRNGLRPSMTYSPLTG
jgi:hypothetical protein